MALASPCCAVAERVGTMHKKSVARNMKGKMDGTCKCNLRSTGLYITSQRPETPNIRSGRSLILRHHASRMQDPGILAYFKNRRKNSS